MDELVEHWTVLDDELQLVAGKRGGTKLGFALLLKYYTRHGRFPRGRAEFVDEVVDHVARQVKVPAAELESYDWTGRTIEYHRAQIREHLGFRVCGVADAEKLTQWLAAEVAHAERHPDRVREELLKHCRDERIEPPTPDRVTRLVRSALHIAEERWFVVIAARLDPPVRARLPALVDAPTDDSPADDEGGDGSAGGEAAAGGDEEAEQKVTKELINAFKRVTGKENILFHIAEASLAAPDEQVRAVVFPAVSGGEQTLRELVHEYRTKGPVYRRTVQTTLKASYTGHYRRGLIELLEVLEFRSNNSVHRPVIDALELVKRYAKAGNTSYYPLGETAPAHRGTQGEWADLVYRDDTRGRARVVRMVYEVVTFQALREQLRCKEVWVVGADRWRDPDEDLPVDFESRRAEHYGELRKPLDPTVFIGELCAEMTGELAALDEAVGDLEWVEIAERKAGAIKFTAPEASPEPRNLRRIKAEVGRRWQVVPLIDMLKEAVLRTGCLQRVTAVTGAGQLHPEVLAERLMLAIYAYGTNTGIRSVAGGAAQGGHGHSEEEIRYVRRRYLTAETARQIAVEIANATFAARDSGLWGAGSTAVASDSTHFRAWDQNLFTEWHSRYGGRGILVYWHVERGSVVVHSQTLRASASEVAAMVEGAIRHGTTMTVEGNYVDSHGQSEIGFGITRLLNIDLLPRIKRINKVRLYRPAVGDPGAYPNLSPALTRPINWDVIARNYDQVIKYATAIRTRTASTEAILSRFTRSASHPAYQAMLEIGRAQRTAFVARYLRLRDLQREIEEGLNVVESWNAANAVIYYGKGGEISTNRREEVEMGALCLRILQASLVYVNTLMLQDVLAEDAWADQLTPADRRGLTPLFWSHVRPYGEVRLDLESRLDLTQAAS
jgi:TnpA family transposase